MADDTKSKNPQEEYMPGENVEGGLGAEKSEPRPEAEASREVGFERGEGGAEQELAAERKRLEEEAEGMPPYEHEEAKRESVNIREMTPEGKIGRLIQLAQDKGPVFAVGTARKLDDPWTLDKLHDYLAQDQNYKKTKKDK